MKKSTVMFGLGLLIAMFIGILLGNFLIDPDYSLMTKGIIVILFILIGGFSIVFIELRQASSKIRKLETKQQEQMEKLKELIDKYSN